MRRLVPALAVALAVLLASPAAAETVTETLHLKGFSESFRERDPCLGPITVNLTYNSVSHQTLKTSGPNAGTGHFTFTQAGRFLLEPDDPSLPDFRGHFAIWGGFNMNRKNASGTFTFNAVGRAADGTRIRFHGLEHFNVSATGVENSFSIETFDCPV